MRTGTIHIVAALGFVSLPLAASPETVAVPPPVAVHVPVDASPALPAMNYRSSIASDEIFELLRANPAFSKLDEELVGSAMLVRITHSLQPTGTGKAAGLLSAIWSGGTLGLLPMVTNNNLVVTYEVRVQGEPIVSQSFEKSFTRAVNIWASSDELYHGLGKDGYDWLLGTARDFAASAATDPKLLELKREYERYFGPVP